MDKEIDFFKISIYMYIFAELIFTYSALRELLGDTCAQYGQLLKHSAMIILVIGIVQKYIECIKIKYLIIGLIFLALAYFIEYSINRGSNFLMLILLIIGIANLNINKYINSFIIAFETSACIILLLNLLGIIDGTFGFAHKNTFGMIALTIVTMQFYKVKFRLSITQILFYSFISYFTFVVVKSRTAALLILVSIIIAVLNRIICDKRKKKVFIITLLVISLMVVIFFIYCALMYSDNPEKYRDINDLFSNRIYLASRYIDMYNIQLFGRYLSHYSEVSSLQEYLYLDCSYINIVLTYGSIFTTIFTCVYFKLVFNCIKTEKYEVVFCLIIHIFYGCSELYLYSFISNFALLYYSQFKELRNVNLIKSGEII